MFFDYWPLKRFDGFNMGMLRRSLTEKSIMIILILPVIAMTFYAEARVEALPSLTAFPWESRISNILNNYVGYLWKTVYPIDLAVFYPQPETRSLITDITAALFIIAVTIMAAVYVKKRPYLGCGWCWYVFLLLPMSGIVQVGSHVMADRYTYVPLVGIFLATVWYADELIDRYYKENKIVSAGVVLAALGFLMVLSFKQTGYWRDTETLFRHAVEVTRNNYLAHNNLGAVLMEKGKTYEAIGHYQEAIKAKPNFTLSYVNLGNALVTAGQMEEGIRSYRQALDREPNNYTAARNLADALFKNRDYAEAILLYMELLPKMNQDAGLYNNLGVALAMDGRLDQAVGYLERAIALNPGDKLARANLQVLADKIRSGRKQ
jgi:Tfp pilus assembly protein PilF